eukprot:14908400-Alexandrium_andersonii.AAC.1
MAPETARIGPFICCTALRSKGQESLMVQHANFVCHSSGKSGASSGSPPLAFFLMSSRRFWKSSTRLADDFG